MQNLVESPAWLLWCSPSRNVECSITSTEAVEAESFGFASREVSQAKLGSFHELQTWPWCHPGVMIRGWGKVDCHGSWLPNRPTFPEEKSPQVGNLVGLLGWFFWFFFNPLLCDLWEKKPFINELCPPLSFRSCWGFVCRMKPQQNLAVSVDKTDKSAL